MDAIQGVLGPGRNRGVIRLPAGAPELKARRGEVVIEGECMPAAQAFHHGEADGIGIRDRVGRQALEPATRRRVVLGRGEVDGDAGALVDAVQRSQGGQNVGPEQREAVQLGEDKIGGREWDAAPKRLPEQPVRLGMMLIAPAPQRDPRAAIDEQSTRLADAGHGTGPEAPPRRSR